MSLNFLAGFEIFVWDTNVVIPFKVGITKIKIFLQYLQMEVVKFVVPSTFGIDAWRFVLGLAEGRGP